MEKLTAADLSKLDAYTGFVTEHCVSTTSMFQFLKCGKETCHYCSKTPIRLPLEVYENIKFIPAPVLS